MNHCYFYFVNVKFTFAITNKGRSYELKYSSFHFHTFFIANFSYNFFSFINDGNLFIYYLKTVCKIAVLPFGCFWELMKKYCNHWNFAYLNGTHYVKVVRIKRNCSPWQSGKPSSWIDAKWRVICWIPLV